MRSHTKVNSTVGLRRKTLFRAVTGCSSIIAVVPDLLLPCVRFLRRWEKSKYGNFEGPYVRDPLGSVSDPLKGTRSLGLKDTFKVPFRSLRGVLTVNFVGSVFHLSVNKVNERERIIKSTLKNGRISTYK